MTLKATIKETEKEKAGLTDGGTVIISCSNCGEKLVRVLITRPNESIGGKVVEWKVRATCCYCKGKSKVETIKGGFHYAGWGEENKQDAEMDYPKTVVDFIEPVDDVLMFNTKRCV